MFKRCHSIEDLCKLVEEDKSAKGPGAANLDRYPIRFVLFDNFRDSYAFVEYLQNERHIHVESVDKWIDANYPDIIITQMDLAERIEKHIKKKNPNDCVIAPFSELARFYDNKENKIFDTLIKTIKAIQASPSGVDKHQRVYIPIVGLEGKMETFANDSQINIWEYSSDEKDINYTLVVTKGTDYGVKGLEENYNVVDNMQEWLNLWKGGENLKQRIICKSQSIFANAGFAQPDNAFSYRICNNAYEFLTYGLQLSFEGVQHLESDDDNWNKLAEDIDLTNGFNFTKYVRAHFWVDDIKDYADFIRLWFNNPGIFDRWLLTRYYMSLKGDEDYLGQLLSGISNYSNPELIGKIAVTLPEKEEEIVARRYCLQQAKKHHVLLPEATEGILGQLLTSLSEKVGYTSALTYFAGISRKEKEIAVSWLGKGLINIKQTKGFFPDLYNYLKEGIGISSGVPDWVDKYIVSYKEAKISNKYTDEIKSQICTLNGSETAFDTWYNEFSTTYTILKERGDIEVFYWIDGLGIDWIPLVKEIISEKKDQQIFLNEIRIARTQLPSKTDINKADLQRLLPKDDTLQKKGDLDAQAHRTDNVSPFTVINEIEIVRNSIEEILDLYIGKKIAIISDHGLTYLSQLVQGKNLAGVDSDHHGRIAIRNSGGSSTDSSYFRLDDGKTLCALRHESLCAKVPSGQGCHGGCTPEEVLVPIFIISSSPDVTNWTCELMTKEVSTSDPHIRFKIKNIPSTEKPYVEYNNVQYEMHHVSGDIYETESITLDSKVTDITLVIGDVSQKMNIMVSTGATESDLFDF